MTNIYVTGDINLLNIHKPTQPFRHLKSVLQPADVIFSNLECCFYDTEREAALKGREGFYVPTHLAKALVDASITTVGLANNVNFGAKAILSSCKTLDKMGIQYAGAGPNKTSAYGPIIVEHHGIKIGFLQRSSIYWPTDHAALEHTPGIATLAAHTAYQPTLPHKPGSPPIVYTWADQDELAKFTEEIRALKKRVDLIISSHHWGLKEEVLQYQIEIAHAAVDAGADVVMGHGAHMPLAVEMYKERPIFYGLAHLFFLMGHGGKRQTGDGLIGKILVKGKQIHEVRFSMVNTTADDQAIPLTEVELRGKLTKFQARYRSFGTRLFQEGEDVIVWRQNQTN